VETAEIEGSETFYEDTNHIYTVHDASTGKIEIYTILGQMVSRHDLQSSLNLESLEKGIYYLRIRDHHGKEIETRRIIKK
jgi:hypothetical protein